MGMFYWFNRIILGGHHREGYPVSSAQRRAIENAGRRKRYARRRAAGMTSREASNTTAAIHNAAQRAYTKRWGGNPGKYGSQAWLRRELGRRPSDGIREPQ